MKTSWCYKFSVQDTQLSKDLPFGYMDLKQSENSKRNDNIKALNGMDGLSKYDIDSYREAFAEENSNQFQNIRSQFQEQTKKSDSRPKYDPGWKFIGLGKRPSLHTMHFSPELEDSKGRINPLLGISTLINFEFINAIRDEIGDVTKEAVKKQSPFGQASGGDESGSMKFNHKVNLFGGRQKSVYDPGWMLTGLGK